MVMTFKLLFEIAFWILIGSCGVLLIWEMIPDPAKKYWKYLRMVRQDQKSGKRRSYIFKFRNGIGGK